MANILSCLSFSNVSSIFFSTFNLEQNSTEFSLGLPYQHPPALPVAFNTTTYVPSKILMLNKTRFAARSPKKTYSRNDRIRIGIASGVVRALRTLWKSKIGVVSMQTQSQAGWNRSRKNQYVFIFFRIRLRLRPLLSSESQIDGVGGRRGRINQSRC